MLYDAPEYYIWREGENVKFFGLRAAQNRLAFNALSILLDVIHPKNIVELGSGVGGLTIMLGIWAKLNNSVFHTYDNNWKDQLLPELYEPLGIKLFHEDYNLDASHQRIAALLAEEGRSLLLCDGGNKKVEMEKFSPHLKPGDFAACHDYAPSGTYNNTYWGWCETSLETVKFLPLSPAYEELMENTAWGLFQK